MPCSQKITMKTIKCLHFIALFITITSKLFAQTDSEWLKQGNEKLFHLDLEGAKKDYDKVIDLNPKLFMAYIGRGTAEARLQQLEDAVKDYTRALALNP